jgi:hypothetical protein
MSGFSGERFSTFGQCVLAKSGANLALTQKNGNLLTINGTPCAIPDAGVTLAPGAAVSGTLYYIYAFMSSGTMTLEFSATAPAVSNAAGNKGTVIKTADDTRTLVGMARPTTGPAWADSASQRLVRSWFNDPGIQLKNIFTANRTTTQAIGSGYAEINTEIRIEFLIWSGDVIEVHSSGSVFNNTNGASAFSAIGFDGVTAEDGAIATVTTANYYNPAAVTSLKTGLAEGYHYATLLGAVDANTGQWRGQASGATTTLYARSRH